VRRRLLANVALSVASAAVFLAVLEGAARLLEKKQPPRPEVADYIWDWDDHMPGGFYVMKSDGVGWPPWEEFNGDGLRDATRTHEKPEGVRRIAILGDSVTLGAEMRPEEAYPQRLEALLRSEGRRVEVMNVALWGWSTRQERIAWQRIARRYHPDQAVLAVCLNDIPELFNNLSRPPRWLTRLHESSALVRRVVNAEGREIDSVDRLFGEPDARRVRGAFDRFFEEVRTLRREVEADGASFAVIVFPFRFQVEPGAPAPVVQQRIASFCASEGLRCLDLLPTLARVGPSAFVDYDHLSASGASWVAETLRASGLIVQGDSEPEVLERALGGGSDPGAGSVRAWLRSRRGGPGAAVVSALAQALAGEDDPSTRQSAAWGLAAAGSSPARARDALMRALGKDPSAGVRAAAARALGAMGGEGQAASAALYAALGDPSEVVRAAAARALARIEPRAEDVPRLIAALQSEDGFVVGFAAWSLGNLGSSAEAAVPGLAQALSRDDTNAVVSAALARIGPAAAGAVPVLVEALRSENADRRWRAARTLGRIGAHAGAAVPALAAALDDPNGAVRVHAVRALGRIGPPARAAAAALQRATGDPAEAVRREAREALDKLH
jgi:HEAT repeat protein/lysophospholipase L1-like esterase